MIDDDIVVPYAGGATCGKLHYSFSLLALEPDDEICREYQIVEVTCCPRNESKAFNIDVALAAANASNAAETGPCAFCPKGIAEERIDIAVAEDGATCGDLFELTQTILSSDIVCQQILLADSFCCVP